MSCIGTTRKGNKGRVVEAEIIVADGGTSYYYRSQLDFAWIASAFAQLLSTGMAWSRLSRLRAPMIRW
jgi:hypothetical protein